MRRLAALLFVSSALVAGCGSDDDEQAVPPGAAPTATPSADGDRGAYGY